jgi:hypothetical protein
MISAHIFLWSEWRVSDMSKDQSANEVKYKVAVKLLDIMLRNGLISPSEYKKIDELNRQSFTPEFSEVYA